MNEAAVSRPSHDQVRAQLDRILASPLFASARRLSQFLEFVVSRSIEGQDDAIKESVIGIEVYSRDPPYDPKADSIVRAEASRRAPSCGSITKRTVAARKGLAAGAALLLAAIALA